MPSTFVKTKSAPVTADTTSAGVVSLASNDNWLPGCAVRLSTNDPVVTPSVECVIIEQISTDKVRVRRADNKAVKGGGQDMSAFTLAKLSRINMEGQVVPVDAPFIALARG